MEDLAAAAEDATRPPHARELGRRGARRLVIQSRRAIRSLLEHAGLNE